MKPSDLIRGRTYYRLTFADPNLTMPGVEPLVFIGMAQDSEGDRKEKYQFQDTVSFVRFGYATEYTGEEKLAIYFMQEKELGSIYALEGIADAVLNAKSRAKERGEPTLKQAREKWFSVSLES